MVERQSFDGLDGVPVYGVDAAPAFIALIASRGAFGPPPALVLSGVNRGPQHRPRGVALRHRWRRDDRARQRLPRAGGVTRRRRGDALGHGACGRGQALDWVLALGAPLVLNVNVPNVPLEMLRGVRQGELARFGAVQTTIAEIGEGFVRLGVADERGARRTGFRTPRWLPRATPASPRSGRCATCTTRGLSDALERQLEDAAASVPSS